MPVCFMNRNKLNNRQPMALSEVRELGNMYQARLLSETDLKQPYADCGYLEMRMYKGEPQRMIPVFLLKMNPKEDRKLPICPYPGKDEDWLDMNNIYKNWRIWDKRPTKEEANSIPWFVNKDSTD